MLAKKATKDKFIVVGVDTFANEEWFVGEYDTKEEAITIADKKGGEMSKMYVYDSAGKYIHSAGSY